MTRICERFGRVNVLVGLLALVLGLAAVPQTATAAPPPCTGTCSATWVAGGCLIASMCKELHRCNVNLVYVNGVLVNCNGGTCV